MPHSKKILYEVQCAFDAAHRFEKTFAIETGSEQTETEVEAFCPYCNKQVTVAVEGKVVPDAALLRKFNL
ncbi:MAG: hypothetical protein ACE5F7_10655 [Nitrospiria bacterium]